MGLEQLLIKYKKPIFVGTGIFLVVVLISVFATTTGKGLNYNNQTPTYTVTPTPSVAPVTIDADPFNSNISINNAYYFTQLSYNIQQTQAQMNAYDGNPITGDYLANKLKLNTFQDPSGTIGWKNSQYLLSYYGNVFHLHNLLSSYKGGIIIAKDAANTIAGNELNQLLSLAPGSFVSTVTTVNNQFVISVTLIFNGFSAYAQSINPDITVTLNGNGELSDITFYPFPLSTSLIDAYHILSIQDAVRQAVNGGSYTSINADVSASQVGTDNVQLQNITITSSSIGYTYTLQHTSLIPAYIFVGKASSPTINGNIPFGIKVIIPAVSGGNLNIITPTPIQGNYNSSGDNDNLGKQ